jgi:hypothetical protein
MDAALRVQNELGAMETHGAAEKNLVNGKGFFPPSVMF